MHFKARWRQAFRLPGVCRDYSTAQPSFKETSKNICACLDRIDRTLIDGFAGLGIESERLKEALDGIRTKISEAEDARDRATKQRKELPSPPHGGAGRIVREASAEAKLRRLQDAQKALLLLEVKTHIDKSM